LGLTLKGRPQSCLGKTSTRYLLYE